VEASLTSATPYAALRVSERPSACGAAGHGAGEVTLRTAHADYKADTRWSMAAPVLRGELLAGGGPSLALTADALWSQTASQATRDLVASDSATTRLRLGLEGGWQLALPDAASLAPKLEAGARHDGGDAETGFGVELGGGFVWTVPKFGLSLDVSGRALVTHEDGGMGDRGFSAALAFDPSPANALGPSLSLRQDFGGQSQGGLDALLRPATLDLGGRMGGEAASRWALEAAYGLPAFGGHFTGVPHIGFGLDAGGREYSLGWRLAPDNADSPDAPDISLGVKAARRESGAAKPEHAIGVDLTTKW